MEPTTVRYALSKGMNFLDTGRTYLNGQNEIMVGQAIKTVRKDVIVQSKLLVRSRGERKEDFSSETLGRIQNQMQPSLQESLAALQTDYIDVLLFHGASSPDIICHDVVKEFFSTAKQKGMIRACGFSSHYNQVEILRAANETNFYDVVMIPYNHKGSFTHSRSGRYSEWNQPALEEELKKAAKNGVAIVAMKTCSGGPYAPAPHRNPSYKAAIEWVLKHNYVHTLAVAMTNTREIDENVQAMY
jgi:predicted aldo/keto reductase-like oxidoreductase